MPTTTAIQASCPGCLKPVQWDWDMDRYFIDGEGDDQMIITEYHTKRQLTIHLCPFCKAALASFDNDREECWEFHPGLSIYDFEAEINSHTTIIFKGDTK